MVCHAPDVGDAVTMVTSVGCFMSNGEIAGWAVEVGVEWPDDTQGG
jgi:hypothetical protein